MTTNPPVLSKRISDALAARKEGAQWESFIVSMLQKLELSPSERAKAVKRYDELARHIARKLSVSDVDVHVVVQGSMRTQTTTAMWGNTKFDLDIVVKLLQVLGPERIRGILSGVWTCSQGRSGSWRTGSEKSVLEASVSRRALLL